MATLLDLAEKGVLYKFDAALGLRHQECRIMYLFPKAADWMAEKLPNEASNWDLENPPIEQLDAFMETFCSGEVLMFERQIRPMRHVDRGVWELKTADLRLFGWFHVRDCFVCTAVNMTHLVKGHELYAGYRDEAVRLRDQLDLNEPKFVPGDDPNAVISAFCYP